MAIEQLLIKSIYSVKKKKKCTQITFSAHIDISTFSEDMSELSK